MTSTNTDISNFKKPSSLIGKTFGLSKLSSFTK